MKQYRLALQQRAWKAFNAKFNAAQQAKKVEAVNTIKPNKVDGK